MASVQKSVLVSYSAEQMFALVDRVEDYPLFLPWCGGASSTALNENQISATVQINYHQLKQSFTTKNTRQAPQHIEMKLQEGPFRELEGHWHFTPLSPTACKIEFSLNYEFSNKLLEKLVGPVFNFIANSFVDSFTKRAEKVYVSP